MNKRKGDRSTATGAFVSGQTTLELYRGPELREYGNLVDLTRGIGTSDPDGLIASEAAFGPPPDFQPNPPGLDPKP